MSFNHEKLFFKEYMPKTEFQHDEFFNKYPEYDGRGILIAIMDYGIDVSLPGFQKTSTGLPKIVDCFDFIDNGKVDTSVIKKIEKNNILIGLSGRKMKIPENWKNPSGNWHLGILSFSDLYSKILDDSKRDEKKTNSPEIQEYKNGSAAKPKKTWKPLTIKSYPQMISKDLDIDCIVWNNGEKWQASLVNYSNYKNLENVKVLTNFRDEHEYCFIYDEICCCITSICNDGNLLNLFIPFHIHGSLVAQVAASHFPNEPQKDGLAPGAQIISLNTFDGTSSNKEIIQAFEKALLKCIELGVNIMNFSFGSSVLTISKIQKLLKTAIKKHGIIVTKSSGNFGPFFSSILKDNDEINEEILTIGSVTTFNSNKIFERNIKEFPPFVSGYSSKGPLSNGARGVTFVVPADAIVKAPRWYPLKKRYFSGTSCSAPVAAGAIACLISGLNAISIKYSPKTIKVALSNTAFLPNDGERLEFGNGIIQINSAFEYLKTFKKRLPKIVFQNLSVNKKEKGIIIYKTDKNQNIFDYCINLNTRTKKPLSRILNLSPAKNQKWIKFSKTLENNLFNVKINVKTLKPNNNVYYSEIHGFHPTKSSIGPTFHLPVTVIVPEKVSNYSIQRNIFVNPPSIFKSILLPDELSKKCMIKLTNRKNGKIELEKVIEKAKKIVEERFEFILNGAPWTLDIKWGKVVEICIYQKISMEEYGNFKCLFEILFDI